MTADPSRRRWALAALMAGGIVVSYLDRVNLSHAVVSVKTDLHLTPAQQGVLLSAFSWGYVLFMLAGGIIVDRFGPVRTAAAAAVLWSLATAWTGAAVGFTSLLASRILVGIAECPIFPANARLVRENFPLTERGRATALFDSGSYIGTAISAPIVVPLIVYVGWRSSLFACALLGLIWVTAWAVFAPSLAVKPPSVGDRLENLGWLQLKVLMKQRTVLGASLGFFCYNYNKSFFLTWFPSYLVVERKISFLSVGLIGAVPALVALLGEALGGFATDRLVRRGSTLSIARKVPICIGLAVGSTIYFANTVASTVVAVAIMCLAFAGTISASPGIWAIPGDLAPSASMVGTIGGIQNTVSNLAGIVAPIVTGALVGHSHSFTLALTCSATVSCLGACAYWLLMGNIQPIRLNAPPPVASGTTIL